MNKAHVAVLAIGILIVGFIIWIIMSGHDNGPAVDPPAYTTEKTYPIERTVERTVLVDTGGARGYSR